MNKISPEINRVNSYAIILKIFLLFFLGFTVYFFITWYNNRLILNSLPSTSFLSFYQPYAQRLEYGTYGYSSQFLMKNIYIKKIENVNGNTLLTAQPSDSSSQTLVIQGSGDVNLFANGIDQGFLTPEELIEKIGDQRIFTLAVSYIPTDSTLDNSLIKKFTQDQVENQKISEDIAADYLLKLENFGSKKSSESQIQEILSKKNVTLDPSAFALLRIEEP